MLLFEHGERALDHGADIARRVSCFHLEDVLADLQLLVGLRRGAAGTGLLSSLHSKVEPAALETNLNLAVVAVDFAFGAVIVTLGLVLGGVAAIAAEG